MDIKTFLQSSYNYDNFKEFIFDKFYGFEENDTDYEEPTNETEQKHILKYKFLGSCELDDKKEIGFFEVVTTQNTDIENNRVSLGNILKNKASNELLDGAIAVFYNPKNPSVWRLSFIKFSYDEDDKQNVSNLKRFTYVLGEQIPIKTAYNQLKNIKYPSLAELEEAFSVEKISKEFFTKYKELYFQLIQDITVVNQDKITDEEKQILADEKVVSFFIKKLLGRIVFLYFVQKKEWLDNNKRFLSELYDTHIKENPSIDFYDEIIEPLFFSGLNVDRGDKKLLLGNKEYDIPYLNGGLFESDELDDKNLTIPNKDFQKILELFDSYNFTVIEDTPHDSEIAIDPEMLGKVFEDLLDDRKEKGAFYTPREIVHYMSKKSIENYLETHLKEYKYDFSVDEFLQKTKLDDDEVLKFYEAYPMKFLKVDNYFEKLHPYKNLVINFFIVAKLRGLWLNSDGTRTKHTNKTHREITHDIWQVILKREYTLVGVDFGSNKEFQTKEKTYKYPTILKYIQIQESYFSLAFLPNIKGDLELATIFPIRLKEIKRKLKKIGRNLDEISKDNFAFENKVFEKVKELQEDCRPLHTEPLSLFQVEELPRQAVVQKGLSTFYNSFKRDSVTDEHLRNVLVGFDYYDRFINSLLNHSNTPQDHLKKLMIILLNKIKVLDPAIGSGAFPMGILHEIVEARIHLGDKTPLGEMKRKIIENSIYGVDIEHSAVEIAKLRFWLSIVVDEEKPQPLPNLRYKIMVGNSLIETINGFDPLEISKDNRGNGARIKRMKGKFHSFFNASSNDEKNIIKKDIEKDIDDIFGVALKNYQKELEEIISKNDLFNTNAKLQKEHAEQLQNVAMIKKVLQDYKTHKYTTELFLYKIYFAEVLEDGGFDVVIANPPYIFARDSKDKQLTDIIKKNFYKEFQLAKYQINLYILFFEKGFNLLKKDGIISFIIPNNWMTINTNKDFREFILNLSNLTIINFLSKVFDSANVDSSIVIGKKAFSNLTAELYEFENKTLKKFIKKCDNKFLLNQKDSIINLDIFKNEKAFELIEKIEKISVLLSSIADVKAGLQAYEVGKGTPCQTKEMKNNRIYHSNIKIDDSYIKYLDGKDVQRYNLGWSKEYLKYGNNLAAPRGDFKLFSSPRILVRQIPSNPPYSINACYTEDIILNDRNSMNIIDIQINSKCLLAILNSSLITFWFILKFGKMQRGIFPQFKINELKEFPIPKKWQEKEIVFESLVDYILFLYKDSKTKFISDFFARVVDVAVYELYFQEELHSKGFGILEILKNELIPFDGTFETIEKVYKKLSNKNHIVAYNVNFIDTLDIVKTIENK